MIHISNNLYLTETEDLVGNPIIGYQSIITPNNVSADFQLAERPIINIVNPATHLFWESASTDEQYLYFTNPGFDVDYIGIARHNFGLGQIAYQLQGSDSIIGEETIEWLDITQEQLPADDRSILQYFDSTSYAQYRLRLLPQSVGPKIAHIKLGKVLVLQRRIYVGHKPITLNRQSEIITNTSESGQFLGRIQKREYLYTAVDMDHITPDFYRQQVNPFASHARTGSFFFAWRPSDYPLEVGYGWMDGNINVSNEMPNGMMQFSFSMKAVS